MIGSKRTGMKATQKKVVALIVFALACAVLWSVRVAVAEPPAQAPIVIAFDDYPPYHFWKDKTPAGLNIQLIDEIFSRMELSHTYVRMPWKRSLDAVKHGDVTALCAGMRTPAREEFALYPSQHLSLETNWVISLAESDVQISSLDDLRDYTVGVVTEYSYGPAFDSLPSLRKRERRNEFALLELLENKRVNLIVGCDLVIKHIANQHGISHLLKYQLKLTSDPLFLIFSKAVSGNKELSERVSRTIDGMITDGTYQKLLGQYK